jgi:hypothetical protein
MANRTVAWTLALGYDWTYDYLSANQKQAILASIRARTQPMYEDIMKRITTYPYDSHGNVTLNIVAAIGVLMAGDIPEADELGEGGRARGHRMDEPVGLGRRRLRNGTAQGFWDTGSNLPVWFLLRNAAGVDLSRKEWVRNNARFFAYFVPPGAPSGAFGDGLEMPLNEVWSRVGKALASFAPSPLARWYARSHNREDESRLELLMAPAADFSQARFPEGTPDSAFFPSIGWAAMHSSLSDPNRLSIFFKSSPYGSYNHSHADQNSVRREPSGPAPRHRVGLLRRLRHEALARVVQADRSTNAITFDGGQGQGESDKAFAGEIVRFESGDGFDYAIGHAEKAYGGKLTKAERTIVYLRPDTIVVHDLVASATPRTWEWNIHALNRMTQASNTKVTIRNSPAQMCVELCPDRKSCSRRPTSSPRALHGREPMARHLRFDGEIAGRRIHRRDARGRGLPCGDREARG